MNSRSLPPSSYRWPSILAIGLHAVIFFLLILSMFFSRPSEYALEHQAVQASIVSSSQLAAMISQANKADLAPKAVETPKKLTPIKPIEQKSVPKPTPVVAPAKSMQKNKQKSLEESILQEELKTTSTPTKNLKAKQTALMDQQLVAEESQSVRSQATQGEIDKYKALILRQIQQNWIMPQNVQNLSAILRVEVAPGGMILKVNLIKSSGNDALDNSAIAAVNKASPLPVPKDSAAFSAFRTFTLTVKPEGSELE